jgi:DNA-binding MarR family transcriptional regulator
MDPIPDSVRRFVLTSIPSVPHLETLMLLWREQERAFPVEEIASRLYVNISVAKALTDELVRAELLVSEDAGARYRARTEPAELKTLLDELDRTYARQVRAVAELIHGNLGRKAQSFANAFYWRKP